jgi:hypothetical protein
MPNLIKKLPLPNGLNITLIDHTRHYFGGFYLVKMEIMCKVPVLARYYEEPGDYNEARTLLGDEIIYSRMEEQMGVPSTEIEGVLNRLMTNFMEHSLHYFSSAQFPAKMVHAELNKIKRKKVLTPYL